MRRGRRRRAADRRRRRRPAGSRASTPTKLVVGLGYIPSVQFAQFYLAQQAGYYAEAGLDVEFQNKIDPDLIPLVGAGHDRRRHRRRDERHPGRQPGHPDPYVATIYGQFPNIVFAKASSGITTAADLEGKKIGMPGRYGSCWIMLQALLGVGRPDARGRRDRRVPRLHPARRGRAGRRRRGDRFANNEPVQLELRRRARPSSSTSTTSRRCPGPG